MLQIYKLVQKGDSIVSIFNGVPSIQCVCVCWYYCVLVCQLAYFSSGKFNKNTAEEEQMTKQERKKDKWESAAKRQGRRWGRGQAKWKQIPDKWIKPRTSNHTQTQTHAYNILLITFCCKTIKCFIWHECEKHFSVWWSRESERECV